jgi:SpoVK/Ycf46/Vps4 family AAA+-type ATPase
MNQSYKLKLFNANLDTKFPKQNLDLWISQVEYESFKKKFKKDDSSPIYVTLESKEPLKCFTVHAILQSLNSKSNAPQSSIYVSKDIKHPNWLIEDDTNVSLVPVDESTLNIAEVITLRLNSDEVENWSEEEVRFASNNLKVHTRLAYENQKIWLNPATKKATLAEVINIIPSQKSKASTPYLISESTEIIFDGLPEQRQTVIDFDKIGGLANIIHKLREIIQVPLQYPEVLNHFDVKPPKGLLLYGPPGNGKTMIARAVSYSMGAKFISIEGPELMSKYVGVAESQLREKFEEAEKLGDCVIFIDEIDSIASNREKATAEHTISVVSTLLNLMDGIKSRSRVFIIGATNRLNSVDPALRRPGRFDLEFEVPVPNLSARIDILSKYINTSDKTITDNTVNQEFLRILAEVTNGFSGADISSLYRESVMNAIRDELQFEDNTGKIFLKLRPEEIRLTQDHFLVAVKAITPTSLRGIDNNTNNVEWENLIGLNKQKQEFARLSRFVNKNVTQEINVRPGFFNMTFKGKTGSGRRTFIKSFASKFNYELLSIDLLNLSSKSQQEAFSEIEEIFMRAKQVAPSIIYILNAQYISGEIFIKKILSEASKLSLYNKILVVAEIDSDRPIQQYIISHKAFVKEFDFNTPLLESDLSEIYNRYRHVAPPSFDEFLSKYQEKPIGQMISELNDLLLLSIY